MEKLTERTQGTEHTKNAPHICGEHLSLVQIETREATEQAQSMLQRALPRIRRTLRGTDLVFFRGRTCTVVLPATSIEGAQVVAHRLSTLLVDVEYTFHVLYGAAAQTALHRLHTMGASEIQVDGTLIEDRAHDEIGNIESGRSEYSQSDTPTIPAKLAEVFPDGSPGPGLLPQLAFLTHYPPLRLFHLFPYALAQQYRCVPVGAERGGLTVATSQRLEPEVITHLQEATQCTIFQVYCEMSIIDDVLRYWERMLPVTASINESVGARTLSGGQVIIAPNY